MLSKSSSLRENFILIPDADWIEMQISRDEMMAATDNGGGFLGKMSGHKPKPSQRVPLPSVIDPPIGNATALDSSWVLGLAIPNFQTEQNKTTDTVVASDRGPVQNIFIIIIFLLYLLNCLAC